MASIIGTTGNDSITGYASADSLSGLDGNDTIHGQDGSDTVSGGTGVDALYGDNGNDTLSGDGGNDRAVGGLGDDVLSGGTGNDDLYGEAGADRLDGGAGKDYLAGAAGADVYLFGKGSGQDTVYNYDSDAVGANADKVLLGAGIATTGITLLRSYNDLVLKINGTDDQLTVQGYFSSDATTASVVETIQFADGTIWNVATVKSKVLAATASNDTITGYASADSLSGLDGNDTVQGNGGNDTMAGGTGADTLYGDDGNDSVNGDAGNDRGHGGAGDDSLAGGTGDDELYGDAGADRFDGGAGKDYLSGGAGADVYLFGKGSGIDTVYNYDGDAVGALADKVLLGTGITTAGVTLQRYYNDLILKLNGTSDRLTIQGYFTTDASTSSAVETIEFADGTVWNVAAVKSKVLAGTANYDAITGYGTADSLSGLDGNDTVNGNGGNDTVAGGTGADTLYGDEGNDSVSGDAGSDRAWGGAGNDSLAGGSGDDDLYGEAGTDRLDGGTGRDYLAGGTGADVYVFGKGSGQDTVYNYDSDALGTDADKVLLGSGIAPAGVTLLRSYNDLILNINGTDDQLTIQGYFTGEGTTASAVETLQFADGTVWNVAAVKARLSNPPVLPSKTIYGTALGENLTGDAGNDYLYGYAGNDRLDGGAGNDYLDGGAGNDTYLFGVGSGRDTISAYDSTAGKVDAIVLGAGVTAANLTVTRDSSTLVLKINGTPDELRVSNYFYNDAAGSYQLEQIRFADGTTWNVAAVKAKAQVATAGNDVLYGYATADALAGLGGNDTLYGAAGNDTLDGGADADTLYGEDGDDSLVGGAHDDRVDGGNGHDTVLGGTGSDALYGNAGNDRLDGGAGNDTLDGGAGNDVYLFGWGAGNDTISAYDATAGKVDAIQLGAGILPTSVTATRDGSSLVLKLSGTGEELRVASYFSGDGTGGYQVEQVRFADGTIWDVATVKAKVRAGTAENDVLSGYATADALAGLGGSDTLYGAAGNDTLDGGTDADTLYGEDGDDSLVGGAHDDRLDGGNGHDTLLGGTGRDALNGYAGNDRLDGGAGDDTLDGGTGNDVYLFGWGAGNDTISSYDSTAGKVDAIQLAAGILPTSVTATRDGSTLVLKLSGTGEELRVASYFSGDGTGGYQVEQVRFADGTIWDVATVKAKALAATAENDVRTGYATADTISGLGGEDTLYGASGNDRLNGGADNDTLYGDEGDDTMDGGAHADYLAGGAGNDVYIVDNSSDRAIEYSASGNDTVQSTASFVLEANVETLALLGNAAINGTGNAQANTITGNAAANIIAGGGGADALTGGGGNDIFDFNALADSGVTAGTWDVIADFVRGADKLDLATLDANTATAANDTFTGFIASGAAFTQAGQLRFADGVLYGNTNADAAAEFAIKLTGIAALNAADVVM
ncbi:beta strand repeat-containing protein [Pseudoduganella umbonata]|nr:calcium-binding protein [Pseudoduganella umbonata]MBB3221963.1 Ca2+-binding RTX toxin-like protein [Pseudoduganella umbonata]